ncbi:MAG: two-component regulator propeller domain-containing protein [Chitinophagaceae bacterium]
MRNYLFLFFLFLTPALLSSQVPALYFEKFTTQNKLSHNKVNCILEDKRGFMWIGTNDGLNRFDGNNFLVFRNQSGNKASLSGNIITDLLEDEDGVLWIATEDGGLTKFDHRLSPREQFTQFKHLPGDTTSVPANTILAIKQDGQGFLWLAVSANSVIRFSKKNGRFDKPLPLASKKTALALEMDNSNWLWVGRQGGGLLKLNTRSFEPVWDKRYDDLYAKLPHVVVTSLFRDSDNTMWYGSWDKVLYQHDLNTNTEKVLPGENNTTTALQDVVLSFAEDDHKRIWMGGNNKGLHIYDKKTGTFQHFEHNPLQEGSIADNAINCVYIDRSGKVWLGTNKGISVSNPARQQFVQHFLSSTPGNNITIYDFNKDENNTLWVGTSEGIYMKKDNTASFLYKPVLYQGSKLAVTKFFRSQAGRFYIGTNYSLFQYDPAVHTITLLPNTENDKVMNKIIESRVVSVVEHTIGNNPALLVSPYGHYLAYYDLAEKKWVSRLDPEKKIIEQYQLKDNLVHKLYKTSSGQLWLANVKEGLGKWMPGPAPHVQYFKNDPRQNDGLSNNHIYDIAEDVKGNLWLSTFGGGLNYVNTKTGDIKHIEKTNNLLEGIQTDSRNNVWMISNGNIFRYNPETSSYNSFSLPDLEKSGGVSGYIYKDAEGRLYVAGKNYYFSFHPDSISAKQLQPEVYLTDFRVFNESFSNLLSAKTIRLNYQQNYFTIEFAAPDYLSAQPVQYAYMLEGSDKDWVECGTRNFAPYSNLKEGTYVFRVKATNNPGTWSEQEYSIRIVISPPVWRRWWFYLLCCLLVAGTAYALYKYRINELLKRQAMRNKIAQDLHDSVGSTLSSISVYSQVAQIQSKEDKKEELNDVLGKISTTSNDMISEMNDIVWAINPRNDSMEKIIQRMESFARPLAAARNIRFELSFDPSVASLQLDMGVRKNFYLIFKEAVNNAIKYSGASELRAAIHSVNNKLVLQVKDNGVGFSPEAELAGNKLSLSGNGLANMQKRATEIKGELNIISQAGKGSEIQLEIPL